MKLINKMFFVIIIGFLSCGVDNTVNLVSNNPTCVTEIVEQVTTVDCTDGTTIIVEAGEITVETVVEVPIIVEAPTEEESEDKKACKRHNKRKKEKFCNKHPWHKHCEE